MKRILNTAQSVPQRLGAAFMRPALEAFLVISLLGAAVASFFKAGRRGFSSSMRQITSQILFSGVEAFWLVGIIALLCGITIVIQASTNMPKVGAGDYFGTVLVMVVVRELGPFFTSLVVIGRSGSALTGYIAGMKVTKEVWALQMMGIDPIHFIVMPAFMGMIASMVALSIYFNVIAIGGGLLVADLTVDIPFGISLSKVVSALQYREILVSVFKVIIFAGVISIISCHYGLAAETVRDVPKATRKAVVRAMVLTLVINVIITAGLYAK